MFSTGVDAATWPPLISISAVQARLGRQRRGLRLQAREGPERGHRQGDLVVEGRARVDDQVPAQGAEDLRAQADGAVVRRQHAQPRLPGHLLLPEAHRGAGRASGTTCPSRCGSPTRSSASPRPSASTWPASPASTSPRSCTTRTGRTSSSRGSCSPTWTRPLREHPEIVKKYFGTIIPPGDNKFAALNSAVWSRRLVHLRPAGRQGARCRCRPTSGSTPRTPASSSAR